MKTSNKILLGILLICFGFFISAHMVLREKYLNKKFVAGDKVNAIFSNEYHLPAVKFIALERLNECEIVPADTAVLMIEKGPFHNVAYHVMGDTLFINGNNKYNHWATEKVKLYIPTVKSITATDCNLSIKGSRDSTKSKNYYFELNNGHLFTRYYFADSSFKRYFDTVSVNAKNNSEVLLYKKDYFKSIQLNLNNSVFQERNAKNEQISITADSSSTIITGGKSYREVYWIP